MRRLAVLFATGMVAVGTLALAPGAGARARGATQERRCPPVALNYGHGAVLHARDVLVAAAPRFTTTRTRPALSCRRADAVMWLCAGISPRCAVGGGRWWRCRTPFSGEGDVGVYYACWRTVGQTQNAVYWMTVE